MATRPSYNDLELAGSVRTKILRAIDSVLDDPSVADSWSDYKKQLVLKMSANTLPRLNEHSGPDGGEIPLPILGGLNAVHKDNSSSQDTEAPKED